MRGVVLAFVIVIIYSAGLALTTALVVDVPSALGHANRPPMIWIVTSGGIGGVAALHLCWDWFGHPSIDGAKQAIFGGFLLTAVAAVATGTLIAPGQGSLLAIPALLAMFWQWQMVAVFWGLTLFACHQLAAQWRRERESVFEMPDNPLPS